MTITIKWLNANTAVLDAIKIYRSDTRNGPLTLIDTIAGNLLTYTDNTAANYKIYFYCVGSVIGSAESQSNIIPMANYPFQGPGDSRMKRGDWEFGTFGEVALDNLPTFNDIAAAAAITVTGLTPTKWYKWVVNGKIIFIPDNFYYTGFTPDNAKGILLPANSDPTSMVRVERNGFYYGVRCPYASVKTTTAVNPDNDITFTTLEPTIAKSEVGALITSSQTVDQTGIFSSNRMGDMFPGAIAQYLITNTWYDSTRVLGVGPMNGLSNGSGFTVGFGLAMSSGSMFWPILELLI